MITLTLYSQVDIEKSDVTKVIDGRMFYVHLVEPGQTLYSISKAYEIPPDELIFENPDISGGLKAYQNLMIPAVSRDVIIAEKIRADQYDYILHIVAKGETLYGISKRYEVSIDDIKDANPGISSNLKVGQYIQVPVKSLGEEVFEVPPNAIRHEVNKGETYYSLSKQYGVTIDQIKSINPGVDYPKAGEVVFIPKPGPVIIEKEVVSNFSVHKVRQGETLFGLARRYMVPVDSIRSANPGVVDDINVGQELKIPIAESEQQYITHRVEERKTKLKSIAKLYGADVSMVKNMNPRLGKRVYYNQRVRIPVSPNAELPEPEVITIKEEKPGIIPEKPDLEPACLPEEYKGMTCKVALMVPLYLDDVKVTGDKLYDDAEPGSNYQPFRFLSFYQGAMLAVDSLKALGLNVEIYLYDVDQEISKTIKVLQDPKLQEVDMIIGPFFRTNFKYVSNFARIFGIKIINPFSRSKEVIDQNGLAFKMMPSTEEGIYQAAEMIRKNFSDHRIILIRHNKYQNAGELNELRSILAESVEPGFSMNNALLRGIVVDEYMPDEPDEEFELPETGYVEGKELSLSQLELDPVNSTTFPNDLPELIYANDSIYGIVEKASVVRPNLIIAFADNEVFALELMTAVNEVKDSLNITLAGLPDWQAFPNLEIQYLLNFETHLLSPSYIDYSSEKVKYFITKYRENYMNEPSLFAFTGYDATYYFLSAFMRYGPNFEECVRDYELELLTTKYIFRKLPGRGYENVYWNLLRYGNFEVIPIPNERAFSDL